MDKTDRSRKPEGSAGGHKLPRTEVDGAFDLWLQQGLHQLYDGVASEPIPPELLRLIEEDRQRRKA